VNYLSLLFDKKLTEVQNMNINQNDFGFIGTENQTILVNKNQCESDDSLDKITSVIKRYELIMVFYDTIKKSYNDFCNKYDQICSFASKVNFPYQLADEFIKIYTPVYLLLSSSISFTGFIKSNGSLSDINTNDIKIYFENDSYTICRIIRNYFIHHEFIGDVIVKNDCVKNLTHHTMIIEREALKSIC